MDYPFTVYFLPRLPLQQPSKHPWFHTLPLHLLGKMIQRRLQKLLTWLPKVLHILRKIHCESSAFPWTFLFGLHPKINPRGTFAQGLRINNRPTLAKQSKQHILRETWGVIQNAPQIICAFVHPMWVQSPIVTLMPLTRGEFDIAFPKVTPAQASV